MIASAATPEFLFIYLTQGQFACVDFDAPAEVWQRKWFAAWSDNARTFYAHAKEPKTGRVLRLHRVVMGITDPKVYVDHQFHSGLENRRAFLRPCTPSQNARNKRRRGATSQYKGVSRYAEYKNWAAKINLGNGPKIIGYFPTEEEAARAYDAAAIKHFGEYACLNFPEVV